MSQVASSGICKDTIGWDVRLEVKGAPTAVQSEAKGRSYA